MKKHLVSYNGMESFEVDLSKLKKLSVPGRVTLFVSRGSSWELLDEELEELKKHPLGCKCHVHDMTKLKVDKLNVEGETDSNSNSEEESSDESKKGTKKKTLKKKA